MDIPLPPSDIPMPSMPSSMPPGLPPGMPPLPQNPPQPPSDVETRNVIDKTAAYVAKNGPKFEEVTKQQNADNPKFAFLFGGENHPYYQFRLMCEIQQLRGPIGYQNSMHQTPYFPPPAAQQMPPMPPSMPQPFQEPSFDIPAARAQIDSMRSQIKDSESNLAAQLEVLTAQKEMKVEEKLKSAEDVKIQGLIQQVNLDINAFNQILNHLQTSCSKDTISNAKKWIFDHCTTDQLREVILSYLLVRTKATNATDAFRLHILYLINDWAHHCQRKKLDPVRQMISRYVPPLYAYTANSPTIDQSTLDKLDKLVGVWEGHKYFDDHCYKQLRNPSGIIAAGKAAEAGEHTRFAQEVEKEIMTTYNGYKKQHQEFERYLVGQIAGLEAKIAIEEERLGTERRRHEEEEHQKYEEEERQRHEHRRKSRFDQKNDKIPSLFDTEAIPPAPMHVHPSSGPSHMPPSGPPGPGGPPGHDGPPPPHLMHPPAREVSEEDLIPKAPYYELPAGMIVPLVPMEDVTYKPIKVSDLRLPKPEPPSQRLLQALDYFYNFHPTPENPRDAEGWEKKGLVEFFAKKMEIRKKVAEEMKEQGKTFEDAFENKWNVERDGPKEFIESPRSRSSSRSRSRSRSRTRSRSRSRTYSSSSSGSSRSSGHRHGKKRSRRSGTRSRSRSRSRSSSSSSPKRVPISRSPSPDARPSFSKPKLPNQPLFRPPAPFAHPPRPVLPTHPPALRFQIPVNPPQPSKPAPLDSQNKGAQLLAKMGWQGGGLGSSKQGIVEPIEGGEVREGEDKFRGIGSKSEKPDMFEEYRKQMSQVKKKSRFNRDY